MRLKVVAISSRWPAELDPDERGISAPQTIKIRLQVDDLVSLVKLTTVVVIPEALEVGSSQPGQVRQAGRRIGRD